MRSNDLLSCTYILFWTNGVRDVARVLHLGGGVRSCPFFLCPGLQGGRQYLVFVSQQAKITIAVWITIAIFACPLFCVARCNPGHKKEDKNAWRELLFPLVAGGNFSVT
jgi:hypothetical protein